MSGLVTVREAHSPNSAVTDKMEMSESGSWNVKSASSVHLNKQNCKVFNAQLFISGLPSRFYNLFVWHIFSKFLLHAPLEQFLDILFWKAGPTMSVSAQLHHCLGRFETDDLILYSSLFRKTQNTFSWSNSCCILNSNKYTHITLVNLTILTFEVATNLCFLF